MNTLQSLSLILPTLNEKENAPEQIRLILDSFPNIGEIIVVDDNSDDHTVEHIQQQFPQHITSRKIVLLKRTQNYGLTPSLRDGIALARFPTIGWMDADLAMPHQLLPDMVAKLETGYDLCMGSRFLYPGKQKDIVVVGNDSRTGILFSSGLNRFLATCLSIPATDFTSGFIVIKRELMNQITLHGHHGEYFIDLLAQAQRLGAKMVELSYTCKNRTHGKSKTFLNFRVTVQNSFRYFLAVLKVITKRVFLRKALGKVLTSMKILPFFVLFAFFISVMGCGALNPNSATEETTHDTVVTETTPDVVITNLSNIPNLNLDELPTSLSSSQISMTHSVTKENQTGPQTGPYTPPPGAGGNQPTGSSPTGTPPTGNQDMGSPPSGTGGSPQGGTTGAPTAGTTPSTQVGCMVVNYLKPVALSQLKHAESQKCFLKVTQETMGLEIPSESYGYYLLNRGSQATPQKIRVRLGNFNVGSNPTFKLNTCESLEGETFNHILELSITGDQTNRIWTGKVINHVLRDSKSFNGSTFEIRMTTTQALLEKFDFNNVVSLNSTSHIGRNPSTDDVTADTTYSDGFKLQLQYETDPGWSGKPVTTLSGAFGNSFMSGLLFSKLVKEAGASKMQFTNSEQAMMNLDETQLFSISEPDSSGKNTVDTLDPETSEFSGLHELVSSADISSYTIKVPNDINTNTAFTESWDCNTPEGTSFVELDVSEIDYSSCESLATAVEAGNTKETSLCFSDQATYSPASAPQSFSGDWYAPYFLDQPASGSYTLLSLLNAGTSADTTTVTIYKKDGTKVTDLSQTLNAGAQWVFSSIGGLTAAKGNEGYVKISSTSGGMQIRPWGAVILSQTNLTASALQFFNSAQVTNQNQPYWISPYFLDQPTAPVHLFLSLLNIGSSPETVTVTFYNKEGVKIAETSTLINGGAAWTLLSGSGGGPTGTKGVEGWFKITSVSSSVSNILPWGMVTYGNHLAPVPVKFYGQPTTAAATEIRGSGWMDNINPGQYTYFSILNSGTSTHTATITFYDREGVQVADISKIINPSATWTLSTASGGGPSGTKGSQGWFKITSSGNLNELLPWGAIVFNPSDKLTFAPLEFSSGSSFSGGQSQLFVPYWVDGLIPNSYSFFSVLNTGSAAQTVTANYYNKQGLKISDVSSVVNPSNIWQFTTGSSSGGPGGTKNKEGWLKITSSSGNVGDLLPYGMAVLKISPVTPLQTQFSK